MQRLATKNINTPSEYNRIFKVRAETGIDPFDLKRWNLLLKWYKGGRIVDLGCLDSMVPVLAKGSHPKSEVWGLDHAKEAIDEMQARYPTILYHAGDIYDTKFINQYFDYVVLGEVLEHLEKPEEAIKEALRILKRNGTLAISVPLNEAIEPGAVDKDRHLWSFTLEDIKKLLGSSVRDIKYKVLGSQYKPVYQYHFPNLIVWCKKI